jgi:hypothetical protein
MKLISRLVDRALPALLMASSVVLLSAGLFSYAPVGGSDLARPTASDPGEPSLPIPSGGTAASPSGSPRPSASFRLPTSQPSVSPSPSGSLSPVPSAGTPGPNATPTPPGMTPGPGATPTPMTSTPTPVGATPTPRPPAGRGIATRVVVPSLGIDLAIVSGDYVVPGNRDNFPLCDVAQYLMEYSQPGEPGTTYLYAHARRGMFLPLLEASQRNNGRSMIGSIVEVYTSNNQLHLYEIYIVKRHATNLDLAHQLPPEGHQVILQTSEGPRGTVPKLQVAARPLSIVPADREDAHPRPRPKVCR